MHHAILIQLAGLAGYTLTMTCHQHSARSPMLSRGGTELIFLEVRDLVNFLRAQVDLMAELADRLG